MFLPTSFNVQKDNESTYEPDSRKFLLQKQFSVSIEVVVPGMVWKRPKQKTTYVPIGT
jgi:hypothetical protein